MQTVLYFFILPANEATFGQLMSLSVYQMCWAILALNYVQIINYCILGVVVLFNLSKQKLCKSSKVS